MASEPRPIKCLHNGCRLARLGQDKNTDNRVSAVRAFAPAGSQVGFALQPLAAS